MKAKIISMGKEFDGVEEVLVNVYEDITEDNLYYSVQISAWRSQLGFDPTYHYETIPFNDPHLAAAYVYDFSIESARAFLDSYVN